MAIPAMSDIQEILRQHKIQHALYPLRPNEICQICGAGYHGPPSQDKGSQPNHNLLNPHVFIKGNKKYSLGFDKDEWWTQPHDPQHLKLYLVVETIEKKQKQPK